MPFREFRYKINTFSSKSISLRIKNTKNVDILFAISVFLCKFAAINQTRRPIFINEDNTHPDLSTVTTKA